MNIPDYTKYKKNITISKDWRYKMVGFNMCNTYFGWSYPVNYWYQTHFYCGATKYNIDCMEGTKKMLTWNTQEMLRKEGFNGVTWSRFNLDYDEILNEIGKPQFDVKSIDIFVKRQTYGVEAYRLVKKLIHKKLGFNDASS